MVFFGLWDLVDAVSASWNSISCDKAVCVDRVPIQEEISDRAVILTEAAYQSLKLAMSESIIAKLERLNDLCWRKTEESDPQRVLIKSILKEVECRDLLWLLIDTAIRILLNNGCVFVPIARFSQGRMGVDAEKSAESIDIVKEFASGFEGLEVDLLGLSCLILFEVPNVYHCKLCGFELESTCEGGWWKGWA